MINTLTLNPAVDKILYVDEFKRNITTRIKEVKDTIGGKGTHVSIDLSVMGDDSRAFGMAHGATGKRVIDMLSGYEGLDVKFIYREEGETRTNYLLNEKNGDSTLITEKGMQLTDKDIGDIIDCMRENTGEGDFLALSGDASNCADPYVYNKMLEALSEKNYHVFLDTSGETLKKCIEYKPFLIKPNLDELSYLVGRDVEDEDADILSAIRELDPYGVPVIAVSLGGRGSIVRAGDSAYKVDPPDIDPVNTVGCGDCYLSGLLHGFSREMATEDILAFATGVSAAAAMNELSSGFDFGLAKELEDRVKITRL